MLDDNPVLATLEDEEVSTVIDKQGDLPFNFEVVYDSESEFHINLINGEEKIRVDDISYGRDRATAKAVVSAIVCEGPSHCFCPRRNQQTHAFTMSFLCFVFVFAFLFFSRFRICFQFRLQFCFRFRCLVLFSLFSCWFSLSKMNTTTTMKKNENKNENEKTTRKRLLQK